MGEKRANPTYYTGHLPTDLIAEALRVIDEQGPAAVSLRALCRRLGVSHAAPANHFPTKTALFTEIAREGFVKLSEALTSAENAAPQGSSQLERLERLGLGYLTFAANQPGHFAVMFQKELFDHALVAEESANAIGVLHAAVRRAQEAGWRTDADSQALVTLLWSIVHGYAHLESEGALVPNDDDQRVRVIRLLLSSLRK